MSQLQFSNFAGKEMPKSDKAQKMPIGIHQAVTLKTFDHAPGEYLDINFERIHEDTPQVANIRLWFPNGKTMRAGETIEQAIERETEMSLFVVRKIADMIVDDREMLNKLEAQSIDQMISKVVRICNPILNDKEKNIRFNLKLVANKDGYPTLRLPYKVLEKDGEKFIILDCLERFGGTSRLKFTQWEIDNKMNVSGEHKSDDAAKPGSKDELPF